MGKALIVDIQNTNPERFPGGDRKHYLNELKEIGRPISIALTPYQRDQWQDLEDDIGALLSISGSSLLLEGLLHVCTQRNHKIRDPHHQGICTSWFQAPANYEQQAEEILQGAVFLEKALGFYPTGYIPPQHLRNHDTMKAMARAKIWYLITNAMFENMPAYSENYLFIVPSGSIKHGRTNNPVVHVYYDRIRYQEQLVREIAETALPLREVPIEEKTFAHSLNEPYLWAVKQVRDVKHLARWLVDKNARSQQDADSIRKLRQEQYAKHQAQLFGL